MYIALLVLKNSALLMHINEPHFLLGFSISIIMRFFFKEVFQFPNAALGEEQLQKELI